ncbi:BadF/BadG/BcrA/BcrD ATPase family protein [Phytohalomonas tamaricis]|uniref:BadF/BadG/BcrA/BcrD ATPase family protein n=1 Tax=Phytohalomonas tamaricis TaxID=2081032 RepID=UPI000D0AF57A|nr:BadF/BadG/BcrA/BcrD ATPase family protein [Phytohalomonas tamaricis]
MVSAGATELVIGVDGGGSGTRVIVTSGERCAELQGGPSGLGLGISAAWQTVLKLAAQGCARLGVAFEPAHCHFSLGLAGTNQAQWKADFLNHAPQCRTLHVESDAFITLLGAHAGRPGAIVALGTGSVGEALYEDGRRVSIGGYGFPAGDEASGAWLGMRATRHVQHALDGRAQRDAFSDALCAAMNIDSVDALVAWLTTANQTRFATLAPVVLAHAAHPYAKALLHQAGEDIALMIDALDPHGELPVALCGGLAQALAVYVPESYSRRLVRPQLNAVQGALLMAQQGKGA